MKSKKLLSLFLAVMMLLSMLPAAAFGAGEGAEDIEITAFAPISLDAGFAGSAAYEDADAVVAYLNENYDSVTAHTYDSGTVSVPVTAWTDTEGYNSNTAGSYTFTAVLGAIPEGYANSGNFTATAEVVVEEADEPGAVYVPGVYSGVGQGYAGNGDPDIKVYVQVTADEIVDIFAGAHNQTATYFNMAFNGMAGFAKGIPQQVIENQSLEGVDAVSGATMSSNGIKDAIAQALVNAKAGNAADDINYLVNVSALQLLSDVPSMMDSFLVDQAVLKLDSGRIIAAIKVNGDAMGLPGDGVLSKIWVEPDSPSTAESEGYITGFHNEAEDDMTFVLELSTLELPVIYAHIIPMGSIGAAIQGVRLDFDADSLTPFVAPDKSALAAALAEIDNLDEEEYLEESWDALTRVADYAEFIRDSAVVTQAEVDAETGKVAAAIAALIPNSERAQLEVLITACDAKLETDYTQASWQPFREKLAEAKLVVADEEASTEEIVAALSGLQAALAVLEPNTGGEVFTANTYEDLKFYALNAKDGDTIRFGADIAAPQGQGTQPQMEFPTIAKKITIDGAGHVYDGQNYDRLNMFRVTASDFTLKNLIMKNAQYSTQNAGRAIHFRGSGVLTIDNCVFTGISGSGGIVEINYIAELRLTNSTFIGNTGGILTAGNTMTGYVANTIMVGNTNTGSQRDINKNGSLVDGGNNLIGSVAVDNFKAEGTLIGEALGDITTWINEDGTLKNNPASPALNKVPSDNPYFTAEDVKGVSRTQYGLGDIGAYELAESPGPGGPADGAYTLPVRLWHAASDQPSMGDAALEQTAHLVVAEGQGTLYLTFKPLTFMSMTGYLSQLNLLDNIVYNENNYPVAYDLIPATVLSTYDVWDQFNNPETGTDPNCTGIPYPKDLSVPVVLGQEYTWVHVYVPVMGSLGFGNQVARIKLDWSNLVTEEQDPAYTLTPVPDETYQAGTTPYGILAMTVNDGFSGLKYFGVQVTPVREHSGKEAVVFTHQRDDGAQLSLNVTRADFDLVQEAQAGFNVLAGDVITVYIVDDLTNDPDTNPIILQ